MNEYTRPYCCPEPRCTPIHQGGMPDEIQPGISFICFGYLPEPIPFIYDGHPHRNDLSSCWCSALKGVVRWQENAEDWWRTGEDYFSALDKLPLIVIARLQKGTRDYVMSRRQTETGDEDLVLLAEEKKE